MLHDAPDLTNSTLVVLGYTGRSAADVERHVRELKRVGIAAPETIPASYYLDSRLLSYASAFQIESPEATSGEIEPVLFRIARRWFLGLGSDHTNRTLERQRIFDGKAACPKPLARSRMELDGDVACGAFDREWDTYELLSHVDSKPYQMGSLAELLPPSELVQTIPLRDGEDYVIFCGTIPTLNESFCAGGRFSGELRRNGESVLSLSYEVTPHDRPGYDGQSKELAR